MKVATVHARVLVNGVGADAQGSVTVDGCHVAAG